MDKNIEDLKHIRSMMERSTKFLSISGLSGIVAGLASLVGGALTYLILYTNTIQVGDKKLCYISLIALVVMLISILGGLYFSNIKAKKAGQKLWSNVTKQIFKDAGAPVFCGGVLTLILMYHQLYTSIPSVMLVFVGLACIYAGAKTYRDVKFLGTGLIFLGFLAAFFLDYGLSFWILGFGVLFFVYGVIHFNKYDRIEKNKKS